MRRRPLSSMAGREGIQKCDGEGCQVRAQGPCLSTACLPAQFAPTVANSGQSRLHSRCSCKALFGQSSVQAAIYTCSEYHSCSASSHRLRLPPQTPPHLSSSPLPFLPPHSCPHTVVSLHWLACLASESLDYPGEAWPPCLSRGKKTTRTHKPPSCPLWKTKGN